LLSKKSGALVVAVGLTCAASGLLGIGTASAAGTLPDRPHDLDDRETRFRSAMEAAVEAVTAENLDVVERSRTVGEDSRAGFEDIARRMLHTCCDERSRALRRLTSGEAADLIRSGTGQTLMSVSTGPGHVFVNADFKVLDYE
jgi:hypothetical protein